MSQGDAQNRPGSSPSSSRLAATLRHSRSMQRLASDGEHASRLVLLTSLVVGVALGSLLPPDIPGAVCEGETLFFDASELSEAIRTCLLAS